MRMSHAAMGVLVSVLGCQNHSSVVSMIVGSVVEILTSYDTWLGRTVGVVVPTGLARIELPPAIVRSMVVGVAVAGETP